MVIIKIFLLLFLVILIVRLSNEELYNKILNITKTNIQFLSKEKNKQSLLLNRLNKISLKTNISENLISTIYKITTDEYNQITNFILEEIKGDSTFKDLKIIKMLNITKKLYENNIIVYNMFLETSYNNIISVTILATEQKYNTIFMSPLIIDKNNYDLKIIETDSEQSFIQKQNVNKSNQFEINETELVNEIINYDLN